MRFDVLTLHPELVRAPLGQSILGRAATEGLIEVGIHDIRAHATDRHRTVDDAPYGGGAGMVMKVDIVGAALDAVRRPDSHVILTSAAGRPFTQRRAEELAKLPHLILLCGHYEGIDARVEALVDEEISLGDFVLTGGELAAMAIIDATARLLPGVLGNAASSVDESHTSGLLEYPQFTRPRAWRGQAVPEVLLSGHHGKIQAWRAAQAEERTRSRRPDLWARFVVEKSKVDEPSSEE
ncbi:MAG: tRNA (guanosine(37)-N1)-methyltransferase TrmD [Deltaproteobacteria bacterium]|nr:tRNA (guanosine(37)-N1)-methyltransferase TrmD [Deltaproteobacteria bacterium]